MKKYNTKQALEQLSVVRSTLYKYTKELEIHPEKTKNGVFFSEEEIQRIQSHILENKGNKKNQKPNEDNKKDSVREHRRQPEQEIFSAKEEFYKKTIQDLKEDLEKERQEKSQITLMLGQAQGEANTYKEQNQKLLESQNTIQQSISEAEKVPAEPEKKSWWEVWK